MPSDDREHDRLIEREARQGHSFGVADRIGREGSGIFRGVSPVPRLKQVQFELSQFVSAHLSDRSGALRATLIRHITTSETLIGRHFDDPLVALQHLVESLLDNEARYHDFVREVDVEWGRLMQEAPYFQEPEEPAHEDDEYTHDSVRDDLNSLRDAILMRR